jgi:putative ABC transport system substrate-binding protein
VRVISITKKPLLGLALCVLLFVFGGYSSAQQPPTVRRIGFLFSGFQPPKEFLDAMGQLGYAARKNLAIEYRDAEGREERLAGLANELVAARVAVIVAPGAAAGLAAKSATDNIPIVYLGGGDPVALGLVRSLARPGTNVTGITELAPDLTGKRLELIREILPRAVMVAVLAKAGAPQGTAQVDDLRRQAKAMGFSLEVVEVLGSEHIQASLTAIGHGRADALLELPNPLFHSISKEIVAFATRNKLPTVFHSKDFADAGGLMSYGADFVELYRRAAVYVDKILKGMKPADLPVEQPQKFEFIINLKTAKQIGLVIPPNVLARADRVIR